MVLELMPDAEVIAIKWTLDSSDISTLVGTGVSTQLPAEPPFPFLVVELVRTLKDKSEARLYRSWMQMDAYASRNDFRTASKLIRTIEAHAEGFQGVVTPQLGEAAFVYGVIVENIRRLEEPDTKWARYMADLSFYMRREG